MSPLAPFIAPERDDAFKRGRAKASGGTIYYSAPGWWFLDATARVLTNGVDNYIPYVVDTPIVVDQLAFEVGTAASGGVTSRVGLYRADVNWQPIGAPLADSGAIATDGTGVKTYTPSTPLFLARGRYLGVGNSSAATGPSLRVYSGGIVGAPLGTSLGTTGTIITLTVSRAYAAFPTPGTPWTTATGSNTAYMCWLFMRISTP